VPLVGAPYARFKSIPDEISLVYVKMTLVQCKTLPLSDTATHCPKSATVAIKENFVLKKKKKLDL